VQWLAHHLPDKKDEVLNRIRALRGGKLSQSEFGLRLRGSGIFAGQIDALFDVACRRAGLEAGSPALSTAAFRRPAAPQLALGL
jgi:hypothetical protein